MTIAATAPNPSTPAPRKSALSRLRGRPVGTLRLTVSTFLFALLAGIYTLFAQGKLTAEEVLGPSMEPTLKTGDRLIVSHIDFDAIARGDILSILSPDDGMPLVKRVRGMPGDKVWVINSHTFVNQEPNPELLKRYDLLPVYYGRFWVLKDDEYFLVGDNASNSHDSRNFGPVHESLITGKVKFRYLPFGKMGEIEPPVGLDILHAKAHVRER